MGQRKYITMSRRRAEREKKQAEENPSPTSQTHKKIRTPKVRNITLRERASETTEWKADLILPTKRVKKTELKRCMQHVGHATTKRNLHTEI